MKISYSTLFEIESCPWKYHQHRIVRIPGQPDARNFAAGAVADELVQLWFENGCERGWMQKHVDKCYDRYKENNRIVWRNICKTTLLKAKAHDDEGLIRSRLHKYMPKIEAVLVRGGLAGNPDIVLQRREAVSFPGHEEHTLVGACDFFDTAKRIVYEMKVTYNKEWLNKDQLLMYAAIFTALDRQQINGLYFVSPLMRNSLISVPFTYYEVRGLLKRALAAIRLVEAGDLKPVGKSRVCFSCDFRGPNCPVWAGRNLDYNISNGQKVVEL